VRGRQILDGILVVNEVVDEAKTQKRSCYYLKWILKRHMILLIGDIWMMLSAKMFFWLFGGSG